MSVPTLLSQTIVSGGGAALQDALDVAAVGDTLVVQAGDYDAVVVDHGVTVLCEPGVRVLSGTSPCVQMHLIPAGQTGRWYGGEMVQSGVVAEFRVFFCDGVVEAEGVLSQSCIVNDSAQASFTGCHFTSRTQVDNAFVTYSNCLLARTSFCVGSVCSSLEVVDGGTALVTDTEIIGPPGLVFFAAAPGIYVDDSVVRLSGAGTSVTGGSATVPAIQFGPLGASVEADASVSIVGTVSAGVVDTVRIPSSSTTGGAAGDTLNVTTYSEPGSFAFLFAALPLPRVPTPFGDLFLLPPVVTIAAGVVPGSGEIAGSFLVPAAATGQALAFQPAAILTSGDLVLGLPSLAIYR